MKTFTYTSHNSEETMDFASELANKATKQYKIGTPIIIIR